MASKDDIVIKALKTLGDYRETKQGIKYDCPRCEEMGAPTGKKNLEINFTDENYIFHCWSCNYRGYIRKLINDYGNKEFLDFFTAKTEFTKKEKSLKLPEHLIKVRKEQKAINYLKSRGFTDELIDSLNILYCYNGEFAGSIIFQSFDNNGRLNYWVALNLKTEKYIKCQGDTEIVFYENQIDKNIPIFITESIFGITCFPNCIPLLGLKVNDYLLDFLFDCDVILILDSFIIEVIEKQLTKQLKSTVRNLVVHKISNSYKDPNQALMKGHKFQNEILEYFID